MEALFARQPLRQDVHVAVEQQVPAVQGRPRGLVVPAAVLVLVVALATWLPLAAGLLWPGTAVLERCDHRAAERYGKEVFAIRGEQQVRWWSPGWRCPLTNGETVDIAAWA